MPISALPQSTVRLLGCTLSITSPLSLVKELVDNSIDAGATSIEVTISANTIDKIQVRDNGRGISFDDFDSLGRRAHTSKLRSFEELQTKGGQTLGFRGEALASANTLATIKVTTKTAQDPVASQLLLKFGVGGVERSQPASAPVGSTLQALKLFESLPVRKQNALNESHKALPKVKGLLQTYALAVPHLKLSLRVPDDPGQNWSYSPCSSSTTREAILQVFGHPLVAQCVKITTSSILNNGNTPGGPAEVTLTAFLPKVGCEIGTVKDKGVFISVDSRPISSSQGMGKKLAAIFKSQLTQNLGFTGSTRSLNNPFMQLSIQCSAGSYDPNVSPMKDELLFADENSLLSCFESLCKTAYTSSQGPSATSTKVNGFELNDHRRDAKQPPELTSMNRPKEACQISEGSNGAPVDVENFVDILDDFPIDDQEVAESTPIPETHASGGISAFEKECQKLGSRSTACHVTNSNTPAVQSVPGEETANVLDPSPVEALMRTIITKVNLDRNDSNTSDENGMIGLAPVQVVPRRMASPTVQQSRPPAHLDRSAPAPRLEDIGRHFQPRREEPIEIALDETATSGNRPDPEESGLCAATGQHEIGRPPMKELTDSDLNRLREEVDVTTSSPSPEPDILRPHNVPRGGIDALVTRRGLSIVADDAELAMQGRHGRVPPPSSPAVLHGLRQGATRRVLNISPRSEEHFVLQTPPSSDPTRGERRPNPPFRPPRNSDVARPLINLIDSDGLRQTRISLGRGSQAASRRLEIQEPEVHQGSAGLANPLVFGLDDTRRPMKNNLSGNLQQDQEG
ncbi:Fc.00g067740.m01.CDS01 [Cosmosporella sp. VM-42]